MLWQGKKECLGGRPSWLYGTGWNSHTHLGTFQCQGVGQSLRRVCACACVCECRGWIREANGEWKCPSPLQPQLIISTWLCEPCVASGFDFSKDADSLGVFLCKFAHFQMLARSFKNFCPNQTGRTCPWHVAFEAAACCSGTDHGCLMVLPGEEK